MDKKVKNILSYAFWVTIAAVLIWLCLRSVDWKEFASAMQQCKWEYIVLSMFMGAFVFWLRGCRWRMLLLPIDSSTSRTTCFNGYNVCMAVNLAIPRAGELVRLGYAVKHSSRDASGIRRLSFDKAFGTLLVERACDILVSLVLMAVLLVAKWEEFGTKVFGNIATRQGFVWVALVALMLFAAFLYLAWRLREKGGIWGKVWGFIRGIWEGLTSFAHMDKVWLFVLYNVLIWVMYVLMVVCVVWALSDIPDFAGLDFLDSFYIMVIGTVASVVPVPGGFGAYHGAVSWSMLAIWGIPMGTGMIFATLAHESQALTQAICGLVSYIHESFFRRSGKSFALIGHPVAGSYGPALFSAAYGGKYPYLLEDHDTFEAAWSVFLATYDGINVTAPYKLNAYESCLSLSEEARRCGAVNLVLRKGLKGYNTDVSGVVFALKEYGKPFKTALVVGTGGAARAAVAGAQMLGCTACVWGRNPEKVKAFEEQFGLEKVENPDLVIYTLPGSAPVPEGLPFKDAVILEAEYRHPALKSVPCKAYIGGDRWFLGQAVAGYSLFTGKEPDVPAMTDALKKILKQQ